MNSIRIASALALSLISSAALAEGRIIPKDQLPASIQAASAKKPAKFPGIPSCSKGRIETTWNEVNKLPAVSTRGSVASDDGKTGGDHACSDAATIYVCTAFGKLSIKCESPAK